MFLMLTTGCKQEPPPTVPEAPKPGGPVGLSTTNDHLAVGELRRQAAGGDARAQCQLGHCYARGDGVRQNGPEAVRWYRKAAQQGYPQAQHALGQCYLAGAAVRRDNVEGLKWLRKAAEQEDVEAQFELGWLYGFGGKARKNLVAAEDPARPGTELSHEQAESGPGAMFSYGAGVENDPVEAAKWIQKAAAHNEPRAQSALGWMYATGQGVTKDDREAVKWWRKAAEQNDGYAQFALGSMFERGLGVEKDMSEALKWYRKSAEGGYVHGQARLGQTYLQGEGVPKDYEQALKWLRQAAWQHSPWAECSLGQMYAAGVGVKQDFAEAFRWFQRAADGGFAHAHFLLGTLYAKGLGVGTNLAVAAECYRKAAEGGCCCGRQALSMMPFRGPSWLANIAPMFCVKSPQVSLPELSPAIEAIQFPRYAEVEAVQQLVVHGNKLWMVAKNRQTPKFSPTLSDIAVELRKGEQAVSRLWFCSTETPKPELLSLPGISNQVERICPQGSALWIVATGLYRFEPGTGTVKKEDRQDGFGLTQVSSLTATADRVFVTGDSSNILTLAGTDQLWTELMHPAGPKTKPSGVFALDSSLLCQAGSTYLYDVGAVSWTNLSNTLAGAQCVAADAGGFWIGSGRGLDFLEPRTRAVQSWRPASYRTWGATGALTSPWRPPTRGKELSPEQLQQQAKNVFSAFKAFQAERLRVHEMRAKQGRATDILEQPTRLPGGVCALAHDGEFLWVAANKGDVILLLHKPSRRWVGYFKLAAELSSLAVSERYLWAGFGRGDRKLLRVDKAALLKIPPSRWVADSVTEGELLPLIRQLSPLDQALHFFFAGDYATAANLLEQQPETKRTLETLFLLGFSYDALGLDKPEVSRRYFEEILKDYPESPWATVARGNISENESRHAEKKLKEMATKLDRNRDGILDEAEKRAAANNPAYAAAQTSLAEKQVQHELETIVQRYDTDGNGKLDLSELERLHHTAEFFFKSWGRLPETAQPGHLIKPLASEKLPSAPELLKRYDANKDEGLDAGELRKLAAEIRKENKR